MNSGGFQSVQYVFLDSGIGGLPYLDSLRTKVPDAQAVYVADTAHFPYGEKSKEAVTGYACAVTETIIKRFCPSVIVLACNTLSVTALDTLRKTFPVPFVGTVPAVKTAAEISIKKRIGVIATERTINDPYLDNLIQDHAPDCIIEKRADPLLVGQIENGLATASYAEKKAAVAPALYQFEQAGIDTLVLACTHFLHIADVFAGCGAPHIRVIDSCEGVIKQTLKVSPPQKKGSLQQQNSTPQKNSTLPLTGTKTLSAASRCACYSTGSLSPQTEAVYRSLCSRFSLVWRGILA